MKFLFHLTDKLLVCLSLCNTLFHSFTLLAIFSIQDFNEQVLYCQKIWDVSLIYVLIYYAAAGENLEWTTLYADFEKIARDEGFPEVAESFKQIAKVERFHEARYRKLSSNLQANTVFKKKESIKWHCRNCGYVFEGTEAPKECPACKHPQAYYEVLAENY